MLYFEQIYFANKVYNKEMWKMLYKYNYSFKAENPLSLTTT